MALDPVVAYEGGVAGLAAPRHKVDPRSARVVSYVDRREARHAAALSRVFSTPATGRCCGRQTATYRRLFLPHIGPAA
ncbi:hypothetical protein [Micromonospora sp. NPDC093277]|uniref:hypothetical protein n=1 Tax=Micromonospora sp. NPDC093277 TaxID=3364291 RepID=UPI00380ACECE